MVLAWTTFGPPMPRNVLFRTKSDIKAMYLSLNPRQSLKIASMVLTRRQEQHVYRSLVQVGVYQLEWSVLVRVIFREIYLHHLSPKRFFQL
jgi:hypothetical protein